MHMEAQKSRRLIQCTVYLHLISFCFTLSVSNPLNCHFDTETGSATGQFWLLCDVLVEVWDGHTLKDAG